MLLGCIARRCRCNKRGTVFSACKQRASPSGAPSLSRTETQTNCRTANILPLTRSNPPYQAAKTSLQSDSLGQPCADGIPLSACRAFREYCVSRSENRSCTGFEPHSRRSWNRTSAAHLTAHVPVKNRRETTKPNPQSRVRSLPETDRLRLEFTRTCQ